MKSKEYYVKFKLEGKCTDCGNEKEKERQKNNLCESCAIKKRTISNLKHDEWKSLGLCQKCGKKNDRPKKSVCRYCAGQYQRQKSKLLEMYGNKCQCCGETHREFLSIDHINNDGYIRRKQDKNHNRTLIGRILRGTENMDDYRILCMNCNSSYGFFGYCPHNK